MRTEFVYSFLALGGVIPVTANAADVQTISSDVLVSADGAQVKYSVGKLFPGNYKFTANVLSKVYGVKVNIGGQEQTLANGNSAAQTVEIAFTLTEETDVELTLVSSDPGESGAGFTVTDALVSLEYDFASIKTVLTDKAEALATTISGYNYAAKEDDVAAANALKTKANDMDESYDNYKDYKLYLGSGKTTIDGEIDALAAKASEAEEEYQAELVIQNNQDAYDRVNAVITDIKAKYNAAVAELETVLVGEAAYLLDAAKAKLQSDINEKITEATQASYASYQAGTAVDDEAANKAKVPTEDAITAIVNDYKTQATDNQNAYNALHAKVTALQAALDAIVYDDATVKAAFATESAAAQNAIDAVNTKVENAKNSAAQLTLNVADDEAAAQGKINTLAGKVTTANAEFEANKATVTVIAAVQKKLDDAMTAVAAEKSADTTYPGSTDYYGTYLTGVQGEIDALSSAAAAAYKADGTGTAQSYNADLSTTGIEAKINAYQTNAIAAVDKYDALQTAISGYTNDLAAARAQMESMAVYTDDTYDYKTRLDIINKRINDIKKAITAAQEKTGAEHWTAMLAIDADAAITTDIANLLSQGQADQNTYDADALTEGMTTLEEKITAFNTTAADDAVYGDDYLVFKNAEGDIETAYNAVKTAKNAINANSETVDYTAKVGTEIANWTNSQNGGDFQKYNTTGLIQVFGVTGTGDVITQEVDVENGTYDIEVYAVSHNAWGGKYGTNAAGKPILENDADDVAYVYGSSANEVKTWITARKNSALVEGEPETYTIKGVKVENGKLKIGLALAKAAQTEWHLIQIKSLKANTASLITGWGEKITALNAQQTALETLTDEIAEKVTANTTSKTTNATNVDNLQAAMNTFQETYKVNTADNTLGLKGQAPDGDIYKEETAINEALTALENNNNAVDVTALTNEDKTETIGTAKSQWHSDMASTAGNNLTVNGMDVFEQWGSAAINQTGSVISQTVNNLPNGIYDITVYAFALQGTATAGSTTNAHVYANGQTTPVTVSPLTSEDKWPSNAESLVAAGGFNEYTINNVIVSDGSLTLGLAKDKGGTQWHGIHIKSVTYHQNTSSDLADYNSQYVALAARKSALDEAAATTKAAVEKNAETNTAATKAVTDLQAAELATLKSLTNVTNADAVSDDATAKKADPADWKVFETGLDADKTYTARKAAIDADITAMATAIAASNAAETLTTDWKDNSITVGEGDEAKTYSITGITEAINQLKADAETESNNYEAYKALQDNNMANCKPADLTINTEDTGADAQAYYDGLKTQYTNDKAAILTRMQASLNARKAVADKDGYAKEIAALTAKVNTVIDDAKANLAKYNEQKTAAEGTQTLWNQTYTEIAATDKSSTVQDWLNELDAIQVTLTAATKAVEENYPLGKSVAEAQDFAAIQASINDVKARQSEGYNATITADNKVAHDSFTKALSQTKDAYEAAKTARQQYSSSNAAIANALYDAAKDFDEAIAKCKSDIETLEANEGTAYAGTTSPNIFVVHDYNFEAETIKQNINAAKNTFTENVKTAIENFWTPKKDEYNAEVTAAESAISDYNDEAKADAFKDVKDLIAKGNAGVASITLSEVEAAIAGLENIDDLLTADKDKAADKDLTPRITTAEKKYSEVKDYINGVTTEIAAKEEQLEALETAYEKVTEAKELGKTFANRNGIKTVLDQFVNDADACKTTVENAVAADNANTAAYNEMTTAIAAISTDLEEAKALAAQYKYETSFATQETALNNLNTEAEGYKAAGTAVGNEASFQAKVDNLNKGINNQLTVAFNTEKAGLAADVTELKTQYNAYVAANGLDEKAEGFKADIDALEVALNAATIADLDEPTDGIDFDDIKAATDALIKLQNDIADKETELLAANASTANADVLADFNSQLDALAEAASLEGYDEWVGQQAYGNTTLDAAITDLKTQIADLKAAIEAEENISFYKDQYQKQITAIETDLTPVATAIAAKQAQSEANATAYETLSAQIAELQGKIDAAKEKVGAYEYAPENYSTTIDTAQDDLDNAKSDIETANTNKNLTADSEVTKKADIETDIQNYLDNSAKAELTGQKDNLTTLLANAINVTNHEGVQKYSNALWARLVTEKGGIADKIDELDNAIVNSSDADYADLMETVAAIKAEIEALATAVDNLALLGDANEDGKVNVLDYQKVQNMILDPTLQPEAESDLFVNLDINQNSVLEVGDLTAIVGYILNGDWQGYAAARAFAMESENLSMNVGTMENGKQRIAVNLTNANDYTAFQMDIVLPEGVTLVGTSLSDRAGDSHKLLSRKQLDGSIRLLASSVKGESFAGNEGAVLYIDVEGVNAGNIELLNILFSSMTSGTRAFNIGAGDATGINTIGTLESLKQKVYDLGGRVMSGLKKGVNIIRRADGSTQKVMK